MDGDFLLFSYDGYRTFLVSIFRDGCLSWKFKESYVFGEGNVLKLLVIQRCILVIPLNLSLSQLRRVAVVCW
ncbi:BnaA10g11630D [Brassica napus]|uniref:BnaA10g11630D protein n=1 Tax=Brassica napus TaxID=3708 RepID=A0A078IJQ7_BRANA|nr:BnaA10g11630D [Brassica napus]